MILSDSATLREKGANATFLRDATIVVLARLGLLRHGRDGRLSTYPPIA
jgi:hypothetical protein